MRALWLLGWFLVALVSTLVFVFVLFGIWGDSHQDQWFSTSEVLMMPMALGFLGMCWCTSTYGVPAKKVKA